MAEEAFLASFAFSGAQRKRARLGAAQRIPRPQISAPSASSVRNEAGVVGNPVHMKILPGHATSKISMPEESDETPDPRQDSSQTRLGDLQLVLSYRQQRRASVDGFHMFLLSLADQHNGAFWALAACVLSVQVRDAVALAAVRALMLAAPAAASDIVVMSTEDLEKAIHSCNFYKTKASNLKRISIEILRLDGDVPREHERLVQLPGVGPKIAHLVCSVAFRKDVGIIVDTHVKRVAARLGWVDIAARCSAEATRIALQAWVPRSQWADFSLAVVGLGQQAQTSGLAWARDFIAHARAKFGPGSSEHERAGQLARRLLDSSSDDHRQARRRKRKGSLSPGNDEPSFQPQCHSRA